MFKYVYFHHHCFFPYAKHSGLIHAAMSASERSCNWAGMGLCNRKAEPSYPLLQMQFYYISREKKKKHIKISFPYQSTSTTHWGKYFKCSRSWKGKKLRLLFVFRPWGYADPIHKTTKVEIFFVCRSRRRRPVFFNHPYVLFDSNIQRETAMQNPWEITVE